MRTQTFFEPLPTSETRPVNLRSRMKPAASLRSRNTYPVQAQLLPRPFQWALTCMGPLPGTRTRDPGGTRVAPDTEDTDPVKRRSGLTFRLVVERYVAIGWTRHRVREKQCSGGSRRRRPLSSAKGSVRGGDAAS